MADKKNKKQIGVNNSLQDFLRANMLGGNPKRNFNLLFGYPDNIKLSDYKNMYNRNAIAKRIIDAYPNATWPDFPIIVNYDDSKGEGAFEKDFNSFARKIDLYSTLNKSDKLARLGNFSILLIGVRGSGKLDTPLNKIDSFDKVIYLRPYSQENVEISKYDTNKNSPRYGKPIVYKISPNIDFFDNTSIGNAEFNVHYSRVIHIPSEDSLENDISGQPALSAVYNNLLDLTKVSGGSSEIFWHNGVGGLAFTTTDTSDINSDSMSEFINDYVNNVIRVIPLSNMDVKPIEFKTHSPEANINKLIDMISAGCKIPKRLLTGSERGQLASSQDESNWSSQVEERRINYCEVKILRPLVSYFLNKIPKYKKIDFKIKWKPLLSISEIEKSQIAANFANAISAYSSNKASCELFLPIENFLRDIMKLEIPPEELKKIKQNVEKVIKRRLEGETDENDDNSVQDIKKQDTDEKTNNVIKPFNNNHD